MSLGHPGDLIPGVPWRYRGDAVTAILSRMRRRRGETAAANLSKQAALSRGRCRSDAAVAMLTRRRYCTEAKGPMLPRRRCRSNAVAPALQGGRSTHGE